MLQFDSRGYLTPYKAIPSSIEEMRKYFVEEIESNIRRKIFERYIKYSDDLKHLAGDAQLKQWVNGSFVTKVKNPNDIDLITFIDHTIINKLGNKLNIFRPGGSWKHYGVDAYIIEVYPKNSAKHKLTEYDTLDWLHLFVNNRRENSLRTKKGFLEIIY
ncbi:MAG: DUF6932 family protein [Bacteroidia bacterium]